MIVREYTTPGGTRVLIDDAAYAGCTPEELSARVRDAQRTAWWCAAQAARRRWEKQNAPGAGSPEDALPDAASAFAPPDMRVKHEISITHERGDCNGDAAGILGGAALAGAL